MAQACADAIKAEIENEALYVRLLDRVTDPAVRSVMRRLQEASRDRHLPAFRRCADRSAASATKSAGRPRRQSRQKAIVERGTMSMQTPNKRNRMYRAA